MSVYEITTGTRVAFIVLPEPVRVEFWNIVDGVWLCARATTDAEAKTTIANGVVRRVARHHEFGLFIIKEFSLSKLAVNQNARAGTADAVLPATPEFPFWTPGS